MLGWTLQLVQREKYCCRKLFKICQACKDYYHHQLSLIQNICIFCWKRFDSFDIESQALNDVVRCRKWSLFGVLRPVKSEASIFRVLIIFDDFWGRKLSLYCVLKPAQPWQASPKTGLQKWLEAQFSKNIILGKLTLQFCALCKAHALSRLNKDCEEFLEGLYLWWYTVFNPYSWFSLDSAQGMKLLLTPYLASALYGAQNCRVSCNQSLYYYTGSGQPKWQPPNLT